MDETPELFIPENIAGPFLRERRTERVWRFRHEGAQVASVVFYEGGGCRVMTSDGTEVSSRNRRTARPSTVCEIARGRHTTFFTVRLAAAGGATFFETKIQLRWEVVDYELVARKRLQSVEEDLGPEIVDRLQMVSENFPIQQAQQANRAIRADIQGGRWSDLGAEVGLTTRMFVTVGTDQTYLDEVAGKRSEAAEWERIASRFASFSGLAGGPETDRLAWVMASGGHKDVADVIRMMHDDDAKGHADTRNFFLRMLDQGRISSPELEEYLRARVLSDQPAESRHFALGPNQQATPRAQLPPAARDTDRRTSGSDEGEADLVQRGWATDRFVPEPYRAEPTSGPYRPEPDRGPEPYRSDSGPRVGEPAHRQSDTADSRHSDDRATGRAGNRPADREEPGPPTYEQRWYGPEQGHPTPPKGASGPDDAWPADPWDVSPPSPPTRSGMDEQSPYDGGREPRGRDGWATGDANPPRYGGGRAPQRETPSRGEEGWTPRGEQPAAPLHDDWASGEQSRTEQDGARKPRAEPAPDREDVWSPRERDAPRRMESRYPHSDPRAREPEASQVPRAPNDGTDRVRRRRQDHDDYWDTDPPEPQGREEKW